MWQSECFICRDSPAYTQVTEVSHTYLPLHPHARFPGEEACHLRQALLLQLVSRKQTVVFKCRPTCNFFFCHTSIFLANKECQFLERANRCWGQMTVRKQGNTALLFDAEMVELDEMGEVDSLQPLS